MRADFLYFMPLNYERKSPLGVHQYAVGRVYCGGFAATIN